MPASTKGASTIQISGSPRVFTPNVGLLQWHRALQLRDTVLDSQYLLFLSHANPRWFTLLWRWRACLPMQNTIIIPHKLSSVSTGRSLQIFLNNSSNTSNTICPRQDLTPNCHQHLPPSSQDAFCVPDHNYRPPHPRFTHRHHAVFHTSLLSHMLCICLQYLSPFLFTSSPSRLNSAVNYCKKFPFICPIFLRLDVKSLLFATQQLGIHHCHFLVWFFPSYLELLECRHYGFVLLAPILKHRFLYTVDAQ